MKIKKGDKVRVISGKDKGKFGVVLRALPKEGKVIVEGIALYKRSMKGSAGKVGTIVERSRPIDTSNVARAEAVKIQSVLDAPASPAKRGEPVKKSAKKVVRPAGGAK